MLGSYGHGRSFILSSFLQDIGGIFYRHVFFLAFPIFNSWIIDMLCLICFYNPKLKIDNLLVNRKTCKKRTRWKSHILQKSFSHGFNKLCCSDLMMLDLHLRLILENTIAPYTEFSKFLNLICLYVYMTKPNALAKCENLTEETTRLLFLSFLPVALQATRYSFFTSQFGSSVYDSITPYG